MDLTIFSIPKPMEPPFDTIQRNAIGSWTKLPGRPRIVLFGGEAGVKELADELQAVGVEQSVRNEFGTPLLSDVFSQARKEKTAWLMFINADVVLIDDFSLAVRAVTEQVGKPVLMVGRRTTVDLGNLDLEKDDWEGQVIAAKERGTLDPPDHIDYFLFSNDLFVDIPPFAVGRPPYDQWLIWSALKQRAVVVDATACISALHQKHDYSHVGDGKESAYRGPEAKRNTELAGGWTRMLSIEDATHVLTENGSLRSAGVRKIASAKMERVRRHLIDVTRPARRLLRPRSRKGSRSDE